MDKDCDNEFERVDMIWGIIVKMTVLVATLYLVVRSLRVLLRW